MTSLSLGVLGATGRMGTLIAEKAREDPAFATVQASPSRHNAQEAFEGADVVVDFSHAEATVAHLRLAQQFKTPLVLGTTGLDQTAVEKLGEVSQEIPVLWAPNTSWSLAIFKKAVELIAQQLASGYDVEIVEAHHRAKQDKPSGTALLLREAVTRHAASLSSSPLPPPPIASLRGGQLPGEHTVHWMGDDAMVTLSHRAFNRLEFVQGALQAAKWLALQPPGRYTMEAVFGL
jgi:4-hydroxy-tetrahydrodipicolinate reductase